MYSSDTRNAEKCRYDISHRGRRIRRSSSTISTERKRLAVNAIAQLESVQTKMRKCQNKSEPLYGDLERFCMCIRESRGPRPLKNKACLALLL